MSRRRVKKPIREWVEGIDDVSLECRDLRHSMHYSTVTRKGNGFERTLVCTKCGTMKVQVLSSSGRILKTKPYDYPEGYLRPKGMGRVTKEENALIRLQSLLRAVGEGEES